MNITFSNTTFEIKLNVFSNVNIIYINNTILTYSNNEISLSIDSKKNIKGKFFDPNINIFNNISVAENIFIKNYPKIFFNLFIDKKRNLLESSNILKIFNCESLLSKDTSALTKEEIFVVKLASFYTDIKKYKVIAFPVFMDLYNDKVKDYFYKFLDHLVKENKKIFIFTNNFYFESYQREFLINFIGETETLKYITSKMFFNNPKYFENFLLNKNIHKSLFSSLDKIDKEDDISTLKEKVVDEAKKLFSCDTCFSVFFDIDHNINSLYDRTNYITFRDKHLKSNKLIIYNTRDFLLEGIKSSSKINTIVINPIFSKKKHVGVLVMVYRIDLLLNLQEKNLIYNKFKAPLKLFSRHISMFLENTTTSNNHLILNEAHHRIKNNLQSIINLVDIEKSITSSIETKETLDKITNRINSISLVHKKLCYSTNYAETLNLREIIEELIKSNNVFLHNVDIDLYLKDFFYPHTKAVSLSLVFNELISNSIKHSFTDKNISSNLTIKMSSTFNYYYFIFKDKGTNNSTKNKNNNSFGLSLIKGLINHDLKGTFHFKIYENNSKSIIKIPKQ